jgi:hypothetical protein
MIHFSIFPLKKEKNYYHETSYSIEEYFDAENLKVGSSILPIARQPILFTRKGIVVDIKNEFQNDTLFMKIYTSNQ